MLSFNKSRNWVDLEVAKLLLKHPLGAYRLARRWRPTLASIGQYLKAKDEEVISIMNDFKQSLAYKLIIKEMQESVMNVDPLGACILYLTCILLKPLAVVETGVAAGVSSTAILQALEENNRGFLHSISLPEGAWSPPDIAALRGRELGWLIPEPLKVRWTLHRGASKEVLSPLLKEVQPIDIFVCV